MQLFGTQRQWHIKPFATLQSGCENCAFSPHWYSSGIPLCWAELPPSFRPVPFSRPPERSSHAVNMHQTRVHSLRLARVVHVDTGAHKRPGRQPRQLLCACDDPLPQRPMYNWSSPLQAKHIAQCSAHTSMLQFLVARHVARGTGENSNSFPQCSTRHWRKQP